MYLGIFTWDSWRLKILNQIISCCGTLKYQCFISHPSIGKRSKTPSTTFEEWPENCVEVHNQVYFWWWTKHSLFSGHELRLHNDAMMMMMDMRMSVWMMGVYMGPPPKSMCLVICISLVLRGWHQLLLTWILRCEPHVFAAMMTGSGIFDSQTVVSGFCVHTGWTTCLRTAVGFWIRRVCT